MGRPSTAATAHEVAGAWALISSTYTALEGGEMTSTMRVCIQCIYVYICTCTYMYAPMGKPSTAATAHDLAGALALISSSYTAMGGEIFIHISYLT
jgi:hypothetical protein